MQDANKVNLAACEIVLDTFCSVCRHVSRPFLPVQLVEDTASQISYPLWDICRCPNDLLNTRPVLADGPTELLTDFQALERWLIASGTVTSVRDKAAVRGWRNLAEAEAFLKQLIAFREGLRDAVLRIENGMLPGDAFVSEVNSLLLQHPQFESLRKRDGKLVRSTLVEFHNPADLWATVADAIKSVRNLSL